MCEDAHQKKEQSPVWTRRRKGNWSFVFQQNDVFARVGFKDWVRDRGEIRVGSGVRMKFWISGKKQVQNYRDEL